MQDVDLWMSDLFVALLAALASALIAYPLGRTQGKQQTLHEKQVKVIAEIRWLLLNLDPALWLATMLPEDEKSRKDLQLKVEQLRHYHRDKRIWLFEALDERVEAIVVGYKKEADKALSPRFRLGPTLKEGEWVADPTAGQWMYDEGRVLFAELEVEARSTTSRPAKTGPPSASRSSTGRW